MSKIQNPRHQAKGGTCHATSQPFVLREVNRKLAEAAQAAIQVVHVVEAISRRSAPQTLVDAEAAIAELMKIDLSFEGKWSDVSEQFEKAALMLAESRTAGAWVILDRVLAPSLGIHGVIRTTIEAMLLARLEGTNFPVYAVDSDYL